MRNLPTVRSITIRGIAAAFVGILCAVLYYANRGLALFLVATLVIVWSVADRYRRQHPRQP